MATEREFRFTRGDHSVPTTLWLPDSETPPPLVLAGHGGQGNKTDAFVLAVRDSLLTRGIAVAAIDAVGHGARVSEPSSDADVLNDLANPETYETMTADWSALLNALLREHDFNTDAIGYIGLSGGTLFGLPFVAADERVAAAALGAAGTEGVPMLSDASAVFGPLLRRAARAMTRPLIFHIQEDDDFFPAVGGRALFAEITSSDKELTTAPGPHRAVPPESLAALCAWLANRLLADR